MLLTDVQCSAKVSSHLIAKFRYCAILSIWNVEFFLALGPVVFQFVDELFRIVASLKSNCGRSRSSTCSAQIKPEFGNLQERDVEGGLIISSM